MPVLQPGNVGVVGFECAETLDHPSGEASTFRQVPCRMGAARPVPLASGGSKGSCTAYGNCLIQQLPAAPLRPSFFAACEACSCESAENKSKSRKGRAEPGWFRKVTMDKKGTDELRDHLPCAAVLEQAGFTIDLKQGTRRAVKYRRADDIVIHEGRGWFDPLTHHVLRHHIEGVREAASIFGAVMRNSDGADVDTVRLGLQHLKEDVPRLALFEVDGEFGVVPSDELDDADVEVIHEYDPYRVGSAH